MMLAGEGRSGFGILKGNEKETLLKGRETQAKPDTASAPARRV